MDHIPLLLLASDPAPGELISAGSYGWSLLQILVSLVLVCGAAYVLLRAVRRFLPGTTARGCMRVIDRCPLSSRQQLWIVEVTGRYFLIGASDSALTRLAELDPEEIPPPGPPGRSFAELLRGGGWTGHWRGRTQRTQRK